MNNIILVGFMGSGKSVVSKLLGQTLQYNVCDTDDMIVDLAGKTIPEIFSDEGEQAFRSWETTVLEKLIADECRNNVIATGGGIVLKKENWPLLKKLGSVVCLTAKPETILQRVGTGRGRPLLQGSKEEVWERINRLLEERADAYHQADWICETDQLMPQGVAEAVIDWYKKNRME